MIGALNAEHAWTGRLARAVFRMSTYSPLKLLQEHRRFRAALASWPGRHVFCFSYLNTGGAEQVHDDILSTIADQHPLIVITGFSKDRAFAARFAQKGTLLEIPRLLHHPFTAKAARRKLAARINAVERPVLFGANTDHFSLLLPLLKPTTQAIHLIHAFLHQPGGNVKHTAWLPLFDRVAHYVFIAEQARREFSAFLQANGVPRPKQDGKLLFIGNAVHAFGEVRKHDRPGVLFVGRDSPEKRLDLFLEVARQAEREFQGRFHFTVVGAEAKAGHPHVDFRGVVHDPPVMSAILAEHDALLVTSSREGFPLAVMEAMAHGLLVLATPVGDIPNRLGPACSILFSSTGPEVVVQEAMTALHSLIHAPERMEAMKRAALTQARAEFGMDRFRARYRALLMSPASDA